MDATDIVIGHIQTFIAQLRAANSEQVTTVWSLIDERLGGVYCSVRQAPAMWGQISPHPKQAEIDSIYLSLRDSKRLGLAGNWTSAADIAESALRAFEEAVKPAVPKE